MSLVRVQIWILEWAQFVPLAIMHARMAYMHGCMHAWMDGCIIHAWMDGWMDGLDKSIGEWKGGANGGMPVVIGVLCFGSLWC